MTQEQIQNALDALNMITNHDTPMPFTDKEWLKILNSRDDLQAAHARYAGGGEAVAWQFYQDGKWHTGMDTNNHKENTIAGGYPVRDLFAHPSPAVPDKLNEHDKPDVWNSAYAAGWNDCRQAIIASQENKK